MSLTIRIPRFDNSKTYTEYIIQVSDGDMSWTFQRRYSILRSLHTSLAKKASLSQRFPPKKFFGNRNPKFIEKRRLDLQYYFAQILKIPGVFDSSLFKAFFNPSDHVLSRIEESTNQEQSRINRQSMKISEDQSKEFQQITEEIATMMIRITPEYIAEPERKILGDMECEISWKQNQLVSLPQNDSPVDEDFSWINAQFLLTKELYPTSFPADITTNLFNQ